MMTLSSSCNAASGLRSVALSSAGVASSGSATGDRVGNVGVNALMASRRKRKNGPVLESGITKNTVLRIDKNCLRLMAGRRRDLDVERHVAELVQYHQVVPGDVLHHRLQRVLAVCLRQ